MPTVLIATESGCRVFDETGEKAVELPGRRIGPLKLEGDGACLAVVDDNQVWRRSVDRSWSRIATSEIGLQSIISCNNAIFCGGADEAAIIRIPPNGQPERLDTFDEVTGRSQWFAQGPPLGVRSLAKTSDERTLVAAVHVGGLPRSEDEGKTWTPTIPVLFDVHQVSAHSHVPGLVVAAAAVGLCISNDSGRTWNVLSESLDLTYSLALAMLDKEVLFSTQDGPFATRSQVWRWRIGSKALELVRDGLPEWLEGRVDTNQIASGRGRAAVVDCGGNLWLSDAGSHGWKHLANGLPYASGVALF